MKYKMLGKSGLRVSELCLGTMTFGEDWGWGASKDESQAVFEAFTAAGGNFIDTANIYTNGSSETIPGNSSAVSVTGSSSPPSTPCPTTPRLRPTRAARMPPATAART